MFAYAHDCAIFFVRDYNQFLQHKKPHAKKGFMKFLKALFTQSF